MKIVIGVPAREQVNATFAHDLAMMMAYHTKTYPEHVLCLTTKMGTLICDQRHDLAKVALRDGADYLLMLDSDMRFPCDTLERLMRHDDDIVACAASTRKEPAMPNAFRYVRPKLHLWIDEESQGLHEVYAVGTAVMLIKTDVFRNIGLPFFDVVWDDYYMNFTGEDVYFCYKARNAGYKIWVDQDLSKQIKHTGSKEFALEHTLVNKEDDDTVVERFKEYRKELDERHQLRGTEVNDR